MLRVEIQIINKLGLHARASSKFTQLASRFKSDVGIARNGRRVNGKSIMGVMMLAAAKGATVELDVDGPDEQEALDALVALINNRFDEAE
ncbi:phosphocarrier protein HPr [Aquitalea magnusonii]|jgi:phosphocarrier protein HPr|uniref:HPr family phosphocarrier protein n=1 Tax=Aquitalea TaxID=407217 RepID=UPI0005F78B72|nr:MULTISPECIES: HPr family phosphocarrier protein [Aquitalea]KJV27140.1 phosphocarrier protein HPr [Aquitalea magnusonii]NWK78128.1 HPr family phosphocarrier protein [Aquitalea sp. LB_tupeE]